MDCRQAPNIERGVLTPELPASSGRVCYSCPCRAMPLGRHQPQNRAAKNGNAANPGGCERGVDERTSAIIQHCREWLRATPSSRKSQLASQHRHLVLTIKYLCGDCCAPFWWLLFVYTRPSDPRSRHQMHACVWFSRWFRSGVRSPRRRAARPYRRLPPVGKKRQLSRQGFS